MNLTITPNLTPRLQTNKAQSPNKSKQNVAFGDLLPLKEHDVLALAHEFGENVKIAESFNKIFRRVQEARQGSKFFDIEVFVKEKEGLFGRCVRKIAPESDKGKPKVPEFKFLDFAELRQNPNEALRNFDYYIDNVSTSARLKETVHEIFDELTRPKGK